MTRDRKIINIILKMDNRGSKIVICESIAVKEQRADGSSIL